MHISLRSPYHTSLIQVWHRQPINNLNLPTQLIQRNLGIVRAQLASLLIGNKHKVVSEQSMAFRNIILLRQLRSNLSNINNERILYTEDCIGCFVRIVSEVEGPNNISKSSQNQSSRTATERLT